MTETFFTCFTKGDNILVHYPTFNEIKLTDNPKNIYQYNPITKQLKVKFHHELNNDYDKVESQIKNLSFDKIYPGFLSNKLLINPLTKSKEQEDLKRCLNEPLEYLHNWRNLFNKNQFFNAKELNCSNSVYKFIQQSEEYFYNSIKYVFTNTIENHNCWCPEILTHSLTVFSMKYILSFFKDQNWELTVTLADRFCKIRYIPSFDGKCWRLHNLVDGEVVKEIY